MQYGNITKWIIFPFNEGPMIVLAEVTTTDIKFKQTILIKNNATNKDE